MSELAEPFALPLRAPAADPVAGTGSRAAAFVAAAVLLLLGALISFGAVLLAPPATWIASRIAGRGRALGLGARWLVSLTTMLMVFAGIGVVGYMAGVMPRGSLAHMQQAADSAAKMTPARPTPAWVERLSPGATQRAAHPPVLPSGVTEGLAVWGIGMTLLILSSLYATIGWGGGVLLGYAVRGRWPGHRRPDLPMGME